MPEEQAAVAPTSADEGDVAPEAPVAPEDTPVVAEDTHVAPEETPAAAEEEAAGEDTAVDEDKAPEKEAEEVAGEANDQGAGGVSLEDVQVNQLTN